MCQKCIAQLFSSDLCRGVFAGYEKGCPFRTVLLAMHTTRSHLEMLTRIKRPRVSLRCERKLTCQNQNTGVEGMGVRWSGEMRRECFPFDIDSIPLAFPLGFDFCGIHASLLCRNSLHGTVAFLIPHPLYWGYTIH